MSAHNDPGLSSAWLWDLADRFNRWPVRASVRALGGSLPVGGIVAGLVDLPDAMPGSNDRLIDLGTAGASALALTLLLRWIGRDRGGFGAAIKLTVVSWLWWQSLVMTAFTAWTASGMDGSETDWGFVAFSAVLSAALFIPTAIALRRLDPDY